MAGLYNYEYYHNNCGPIAYEDPKHWVEFFGAIADHIIADLGPKTVLDAGCAMGYLVAALRDRGVEAYGIDISDYAISKVREDVRPYCVVGSLTEPLPEVLPQRYDLVVTIEVLEHLYEEEGKQVIRNLCALSDHVLFSSTPDDFKERTHFNVQQREYWARLFASEGFLDDLNYRPTYLTAYASYFKKSVNWLRQLEDYERNIRMSDQELKDTLVTLEETQRVMNETGTQLGETRRELEETQHALNETGVQLGEARRELEETQRVMNETGMQLGETRRELEETQRVMNETGVQLGEARRELEETRHELKESQSVINSKDRQIEKLELELSQEKGLVKNQEMNLVNLKFQLTESEHYCKELEEQVGNLHNIQNSLNVQCTSLTDQKNSLENLVADLHQNLAQKEQLLLDIQNSFSWKITRPLFNIKTAIYFWMEKRSSTRKIRKAISILRHRGWKALRLAMKQHFEKKRVGKEFDGSRDGTSKNIQYYTTKNDCAPYDSEYQENMDFSGFGLPKIKLLAFYLPQYHTFPENDAWWGKGFTEWVNVRKGEPRFAGHYQPRVPHTDIGYYSLDDITTIKYQVELAKQHGIYGFCFYYYWFSGKRLMEKPVDLLLEHPEIELPFCLCWANENWTRTWDGQEKNILIKQEYSDIDDESFIGDLEKYIRDKRYIRIGGKPVLLVYNPGQIPDPQKTFTKWRICANKLGLGKILIWTCQTANNTAKLLNIEDCIDAEVEFPPHNMWLDSLGIRDIDVGGKSAFIYNYQKLVQYMEGKLKNREPTRVPIHRSCMMAWDNAARRKDNWFTFYGFSLHSLYHWILALVERTQKDFEPEEQFAFINAWNEWGEGTYLEPDEKYGYANINTVSKGIFSLPFQNNVKILDETAPALSEEAFDFKTEPMVAVQVHVFYLEVLDEIIQYLNQIPYLFDCYISTDTEDKKELILKKIVQKCTCRNVEVQVFPNRGRDVAPFLLQMAPVITQYEFICHIHSKKTSTSNYGDSWRRYSLRHLFGCKEYLKRIFYLFSQDEKLGLIMPETYPVLELQAEWGGNRGGVEILLERMHCNCVLPEIPTFPVGNMFWARTAAIQKLFTLGLLQSDFPEEEGQVNGTLAHQIERVWVYLTVSAGYGYCKVFNNCKEKITLLSKKRLGIYAHYDRNNIISDDDLAMISAVSQITSNLIFISNSSLNETELNKVKSRVKEIRQRQNIGFDFGAWQDALLELGKENIAQFDELILINNSCIGPVFDLREIFSTMEESNLDFWGNTIFPYSPDGSYIHRDYIPEHIQSYFMVFQKSVLKSEVFWEFWENIGKNETLIDVIATCESQLTKKLAEAGFSYGPYIEETRYISEMLNNYAIPYEKPTSLLLLRNPFVKKKCYQSMNMEEQIRLEWLLAHFMKGTEKENNDN